MKFLIAVTSLLANQAFGFFAFDQEKTNSGPIIHHTPDQALSSQSSEPAFQQAYGAMSKSQHDEAEAVGPNASGLRSSSESSSESSYKDVAAVLTLAQGMIPEADEFAALRNCFTKRAHKFPEKMEYWNTFKMYLASDWFKLWGYQCKGDFKCWKFVLTQFPQFGKAQARDTARCVIRLVKAKNHAKK
jgi:hypothetical protein